MCVCVFPISPSSSFGSNNQTFVPKTPPRTSFFLEFPSGEPGRLGSLSGRPSICILFIERIDAPPPRCLTASASSLQSRRTAAPLNSPERWGGGDFWSKGRVKVVKRGFGRCAWPFENKRAEEEERLLDSIMFCPAGSFVSVPSRQTHFISSERAQSPLLEEGWGPWGGWGCGCIVSRRRGRTPSA